MIRIFKDAHYDFLGKRKSAYVLTTGLLALLTAIALYFQFARGSWLNYGVDFLGGTLVQVTIEGETDANSVRSTVEAALPGSEVTNFGGENAFLVRAPGAEDGANTADVVVQTLNEHYGAGRVEMTRRETVGPKIGNELQGKALWALFWSFLATLAYLAVRFEWRFGVAALVATLHDVLLTLLLIAALRLEVSLPTIAAVLTIVGYSLNDTIVIFDRIRENRKALGRRMSSIDLLNRSINETLGRTVITGGSTLLALLSLYILGPENLRDFALILILGIALGTYSSIFIGAATLHEIETRAGESDTHPHMEKKQTTRAAL